MKPHIVKIEIEAEIFAETSDYALAKAEKIVDSFDMVKKGRVHLLKAYDKRFNVLSYHRIYGTQWTDVQAMNQRQAQSKFIYDQEINHNKRNRFDYDIIQIAEVKK